MAKFIFLIASMTFLMSGCGKKEVFEAPSEIQEEAIQSAEPLPAEQPASIATETAEKASESLSQLTPIQEALIPDKPTDQDIQKALMGAGLYDGKVDGVIGPRTKKAIEDFQAKNNLVVDGKVGQKTWEKLKQYFNVQQAVTSPAQTEGQ